MRQQLEYTLKLKKKDETLSQDSFSRVQGRSFVSNHQSLLNLRDLKALPIETKGPYIRQHFYKKPL
jgi:hypothetical protein